MALRAAGLNRTYRRVFPPPGGLGGSAVPFPGWMAQDSFNRFDLTLCIPRDGDGRYPHSAGCDRFEPKVFPPTPSAEEGYR